MSAESARETWIPLVEYSMRKGVSMSTLRRYIKSGKIPFRLEEGRYLVLDKNSLIPSAPQIVSDDFDKVQKELQGAKEEIAELKMLIALYEDQMSKDLEP